MPKDKDISPLEKAMMTAQVQNIFGDKQSYEYEGAAAESTYQPYSTMYDYTEPMQGGDEMSMVESMLSPGPGYNVLGRMKGKWESGKPMQAAGELPLLLLALGGLLGGKLSKKLMQKMVKGNLTKSEAVKVERALEHIRTTSAPASDIATRTATRGERVLSADDPVLRMLEERARARVPYQRSTLERPLLYSSPTGPVPAPSFSPIALPGRPEPPLVDMGGFIKGRR